MKNFKELNFPRDNFVLRFYEENGEFVCRLTELDLETLQYGLNEQAQMEKIYDIGH
jgi:hypothetical protein